ncbi:MAG: PglZ domain-containing protein [Candidatus Kapaibacteriota bacterium]
MNKGTLLWIDDEIELLRPHIILLKEKGYDVDTASNGEDGIELVKNKHYNIVFLDETMVGLTGLETLPLIKKIDPTTNVVMVTKNEAESLMDEAIGKSINDYLTKPVNPAQILLTCKKFIEEDKIKQASFIQSFLSGFNQLSQKITFYQNWEDWVEIYSQLVDWTLELDRINDTGLEQTLQDLWKNANTEFAKYVEENYRSWLTDKPEYGNPPLSPHLLNLYLESALKKGNPVFLIVVDCMRYDQWLTMKDLLNPYFSIKTDFYSSILPTATPYARNAIFAGLYPIQIKQHYPQWWNVDSNSEDHKQNAFEKDLLEAWVERKRIKLKSKYNFIKIFDTDFGRKVEREFNEYLNNHLTAIVINAVDMIAHSRSDYAILKEIAPNESAYRSLTRSWFSHSSLLSILKMISEKKEATVIITTDHGSVRCMRGIQVLGDKDTSTNLRYKFGKNVKADTKNAMLVKNLEEIKLPKQGISVSNYIAKEDTYFVYPTDYHFYLSKYRDSFQHGGISLEEMIIPISILEPR